MTASELRSLYQGWLQEPGYATWGVFADAVRDYERPAEWWLKRVLARPDSRLPRLAWAVIAEPQWHARAELVRVQIERNQTEDATTRTLLWNREKQLLENIADLLPPEDREALVGLFGMPVWNWGFIEEVTAPPRRLSNVETLLARHPIRCVNLSGPTDMFINIDPWGNGWNATFNGGEEGGWGWTTRAEMVREFANRIQEHLD